MRARREAGATWEGTLEEGAGRLHTGSGVASGASLSWRARLGEDECVTSPEELIAAAHAGCFSMALSQALQDRGAVPERLDVDAICTLEVAPDGARVSTVRLTVRGRVPGITKPEFAAAIQDAEARCPVSNAVRGNVTVELDAALETSA